MGVSIVPTLRVLKPAALIGVVGLVGMFAGYWANATFFPGTTPVQPINFSHRIHAGDFEIPCQYCHTQARRSISAGVPSVNKCVGCHNEVATDRPEIRKLMNYWVNKDPIPWIKVHDLPDFVYFPHKRHVQANIECQSCHGPVQTMDVVTRIAPLQMGWCRDCHLENEVQHGQDCLTCHK
ncbi:MAG: menaquinol oxidoreductase [Gammaproteobacteria bacterium]|nr:MAG: menaquinol oxidoreductase [Gammaproteobacteria bacterium]